jgi:hypothetical protein
MLNVSDLVAHKIVNICEDFLSLHFVMSSNLISFVALCKTCSKIFINEDVMTKKEFS